MPASCSGDKAGASSSNLIVSDPQILGGKPFVRCTRLSVEFLFELAASGATLEQTLNQYLSSQLTASQRRCGTAPTPN